MKSKILYILRQNKGPISEKHIKNALTASTESIKKQILELQEAGYEINRTNNGYTLCNEPDIPFPWEFPGRESNILFFQEVSSTMDIARDIARQGCPDFTLVIAEIQNMGRGRLQRVWQSALGGLYFTIVLRPQLDPLYSFRINFTASLVLAKVLQKMFQIDAKVKWPNDILVDELKLCGMLSEMEATSGKISYINLGIGINANNDPAEHEPNAISLQKILGHDIDRRALLSCFLDEFQTRVTNRSMEGIVAQWKQHTITIGRRVKVLTIQDCYEGLAIDVDESGALILEQENGQQKRVIYGDCFHES